MVVVDSVEVQQWIEVVEPVFVAGTRRRSQVRGGVADVCVLCVSSAVLYKILSQWKGLVSVNRLR